MDGQESREYAAYKRMWSKRYLQRVRSAVHTVAMVRSEIRELEASMDGLAGIDYARDRVALPPDDEGLLRRVERMDALRSEYRAELDANLQAQADAHRALSNVAQPWRSLLTYRYLQGMTWADVAEAMKEVPGGVYSPDHIRRDLHDEALERLFPYVPHEYDDFPEAI